MTERLAQQELLESPAPRRLAVASGHAGAWWGVDPSTRGVAVACAWIRGGEVARAVRTAPFAALEGPARLSEIYAQTALFARELAGVWPAPGVVMVEQPSGKFDKPTLSYAVGVIMAAVYDGLVETFGRAVRVETCTSSWWKKRACGYGAIYKPKRGDSRPYGVLTWAQANGYGGTSWDEADALGIAEAARREVALEER